MRKQWTLEMHYPNDGEGSLISSESFDNFAEVDIPKLAARVRFSRLDLTIYSIFQLPSQTSTAER